MYNNIEEFDNVISYFGKFTFYDLKVNEGIIKDIYIENSKAEENYFHFDNFVGNLTVRYEIDSKNEEKNESFKFSLATLLTNENDAIRSWCDSV